MFVAASLAAFSAEHFGLAKFIQQGVPSWIPWHLFWAYFVGCALLAAALSIATKVQARLSATLLGLMIFFFVLSIHLPKVLANPHDRSRMGRLGPGFLFRRRRFGLWPDLTRKRGEITVPTS